MPRAVSPLPGASPTRLDSLVPVLNGRQRRPARVVPSTSRFCLGHAANAMAAAFKSATHRRPRGEEKLQQRSGRIDDMEVSLASASGLRDVLQQFGTEAERAAEDM